MGNEKAVKPVPYETAKKKRPLLGAATFMFPAVRRLYLKNDIPDTYTRPWAVP